MDELEFIEAIKLIDKIYKELYKSEEVLHRNNNVLNKYENIKKYIDRLEKIHLKIKNNPKYIERLKLYYYKKYIIKPEHLKEKDKYEQIVQNQCISLNRWLDFYFSSTSDDIPMWAKFWSFQGMLRLGTFNKNTGKFNKREKNNTSVFADLNIEALRLSIELLRKYLNEEPINDKDLFNLVKTGSFKKIYENSLKVLSLKKDPNYDGIWIKYNSGSNPLTLVSSLQGFNTDWCIAGFATAYKQLSEGDFYLYYTKDKNGKYKVPRLCIRMYKDNIIREICGVAPKQNIETGFEEIIIDKINNFQDKSEFTYGLTQLSLLTRIYRKFKNNEKLSREELIFIYEINTNIIGVVPHKDPRIQEILNTRDKKYDLSIIFNCSEDEIALSQDELFDNPNNIICLYDNLTVYDENITFPKLQFIKGNLTADYLKSADGFKSLNRVGGNISCDVMTNILGFRNLLSIGGSASFSNLKTSIGLENLISIGNNAYFPELLDTLGFRNLKIIGLNSFFPKYAEAFFPKIIDAKGLEKLEKIKGSLIFYKLKSLEPFISLKEIRSEANLPSLETIINLDKIMINDCGGRLCINDNIQKELDSLLNNRRIK